MAEKCFSIVPEKSPQESIKVLLDCRKIFDGGIGVYTQNLIKGLVEFSQVELSVLLSNTDHETLLKNKTDWLEDVDVINTNAKSYSFDEYFKLAKQIPQNQFDLFHSPHFTLPFGLKIPSVVTIHDLIQINQPEKFYYPFVAKCLIASSIKRAKNIITVSNSSASDIKNRFSYMGLKNKIAVVSNAISSDYELVKDSSDYLQKKFSISGNYLFAVYSNLKPHKGLKDLILAFKKLSKESQKVPKDLKLVLAGIGIEELVKNDELLSLTDNCEAIRLLGKVSEEDLINLYSGANALVVSSKAEGFCLPVLQAHSQGTSVITRPVPAVKELLCTGDLLCKDFTKKSLKNGIENFFINKSEDSKQDIIESVEDYSYKETARRVLDIYFSSIKK